MYLAHDRGRQARRIGGRAGYQKHATGRVLQVREIDDDFSVTSQPILLNDAHHSGDRKGFLGIEPQVFSNWVVIGPKPSREILIDDRHLLAIAIIVLGEESASEQWNLHGSK